MKHSDIISSLNKFPQTTLDSCTVIITNVTSLSSSHLWIKDTSGKSIEVDKAFVINLADITHPGENIVIVKDEAKLNFIENQTQVSCPTTIPKIRLTGSGELDISLI